MVSSGSFCGTLHRGMYDGMENNTFINEFNNSSIWVIINEIIRGDFLFLATVVYVLLRIIAGGVILSMLHLLNQALGENVLGKEALSRVSVFRMETHVPPTSSPSRYYQIVRLMISQL